MQIIGVVSDKGSDGEDVLFFVNALDDGCAKLEGKTAFTENAHALGERGKIKITSRGLWVAQGSVLDVHGDHIYKSRG